MGRLKSQHLSGSYAPFTCRVLETHPLPGCSLSQCVQEWGPTKSPLWSEAAPDCHPGLGNGAEAADREGQVTEWGCTPVSKRAKEGMFSPAGLPPVPQGRAFLAQVNIAQRTKVRGSPKGAVPASAPAGWRAACYLTSSQTLHPQGAPAVSRGCSGERPSLRGSWRRGVQSPPLHGAAGAQPRFGQGLLVCLRWRVTGHSRGSALWPGS